MIARSLILAVCVAVLSPGLSPAQPDTKGGALVLTAPPPSTAERKMYEDIEILRRILDHKLHTLYPPTSIWNELFSVVPLNQQFPTSSPSVYPNNFLSNQQFPTPSPSVYPNNFLPNAGQYNTLQRRTQTQEVSYQLEGVYLKGQGVVYTVMLPTLQASTKVEKPAKPISEWESVRREFRKEKETPKKADEGKESSLREVLLKVLAENGHHFSRLGENESLTIVVTVHEENKPQPPRKSAEKPAKPDAELVRTRAIEALGSAASSSKINDLELLGDLHLKQGRHDEAVTAFEKAVELRRAFLAKAGFTPADDPAMKQAAMLYRKLAQAYLMQGQDEKARSQIDQVMKFMKAAEAKNKPAPAAKPETDVLPVKMIISVPRKLLDQAGEGKLSFEEFCRRASVETLRFEALKR